MIADQAGTHEAVDVVFRSEPAPGVRYGSNLTIYDEQLIRGRYVGHYHATVGRLKYTQVADRLLDEMVGRRPVEAFALNVDGFSLSSHWHWSGATEEHPVPALPGVRHAIVELTHELRPIQIKIHTQLDSTPFLVRWLEITNTGTQPAALSEVVPWSGLLWFVPQYRSRLPESADAVFKLGYFAQTRFGHEGDFTWEPLRSGTFAVQGCHGRSGWGLPFFLARNDVTGESVVAHLAWSGNWVLQFSVDTEWPLTNMDVFYQEGPPSNAGLFFKASPAAVAPQRVIAPGETVISPAVHLGYLREDLDGCIQALHDHLRRSVFIPHVPDRTLLVGSGRVVEGDDAWLKREIDMAADVGCEYFMVDAGWYGTKPYSWFSTVGDWNVGHWLLAGLQGLREYIRQKGMLFGLWMEPESIGSDSVLLREHPDWQLTRDGEPVSRVLDLSKDEVTRWVEDEIVRVIREHDVDIFKLDYNTAIHEGGQRITDGQIENTLWRHYEALYGIFDRVREQFPQVVLENCAGGGGRNDIGLGSRFHISCQSDWTIPPRSLQALNNLTMALPPDRLKYYFGHIPGYHEYGDLDFQLRVVLFANPIFVGFGPTAEGMDPQLRERIRRYIELYKQFMRPLLPTCRVFHHTPAQALAATPAWCVLEYAAPDGTRAYAGLFRLNCTGDSVYHFRARGLDYRCNYQVTFANSGVTVERSGVHLMQEGLLIRLECALTSELLLFESV